jgi:DNA-directed RNA polymerase III subunit RPC5
METLMDVEDDFSPEQVPLEEDEVIAEVDVYALPPADGSSLYLLQFPLRSPDREYEDVHRVRLKPNVKRMEWMIPLNRKAGTYNEGVEKPEIKAMTGFSLQSSRVDPEVSGLSVCMRVDNVLCLSPVSQVLRLRHSPAYLDVSKDRDKPRDKASGVGSKDGKDINVKEELAPITVQVKRHETEQQTEARLRSYAFHAQKEEADAWVDLKHYTMSSSRCKQIREGMAKAARGVAPASATIQRSAFTEFITPGPSALAPTLPGVDAALREDDTAGTMDGFGRPAEQLRTQSLPQEVLAELPSQIGNFFRLQPVLNLRDIRSLLEQMSNRPALVKAVTSASETGLHEGVVASGEIVCIKQRYMKRSVGNESVDPLREVVLELLEEKDSLKRGDVTQRAEARGIAVLDATYQKVMKELCYSRGSVWSLKPGAPTNDG